MQVRLRRRAVALHVAVDGNDAWSGRPALNAAKSDGPFATLQLTRDEIRRLKQAGPLPPGGIAVELAGGIYQMTQPLDLNPAGSRDRGGADRLPGAEAREVRLVGGRVVSRLEDL